MALTYSTEPTAVSWATCFLGVAPGHVLVLFPGTRLKSQAFLCTIDGNKSAPGLSFVMALQIPKIFYIYILHKYIFK
jgi:hypothetical protein